MGCISLIAFHVFSEVDLKVKEHCGCDIAVKLLATSTCICAYMWISFFGVVLVSILLSLCFDSLLHLRFSS